LPLALHFLNLKRWETKLFKVELRSANENLLESELFGTKQVLFTGAAKKKREGRLKRP